MPYSKNNKIKSEIKEENNTAIKYFISMDLVTPPN